jgi:hypothetical protein
MFAAPNSRPAIRKLNNEAEEAIFTDKEAAFLNGCMLKLCINMQSFLTHPFLTMARGLKPIFEYCRCENQLAHYNWAGERLPPADLRTECRALLYPELELELESDSEDGKARH